jgi:hypothetical protein
VDRFIEPGEGEVLQGKCRKSREFFEGVRVWEERRKE